MGNENYNDNQNTHENHYVNLNENNTYPNVRNYQNNQDNSGNGYPSGSYYSYNNTGQNYGNPYYPTPSLKENKGKKKKKRGFISAIKLTASAVAFGLIAGAVFQGFSLLTSFDRNKNTGDNQPFQIEQTIEEGDTAGSIAENASEDSSVVPTSSSKDPIVTDVSDVVEKVMPSIVAINSSGTAIKHDFFGRQYSQPMEGSGSGIIIGQNGTNILIVTNNHVIDGADTVEIVFMDNTTAEATVKGSDAGSDLAVLSVSMSDMSEETASKIKVATLGDSDKMKPGQMAIAIGNALGYGQSVTVGYISAVNRDVTIDNNTMTLLQTDAAINPGNSGGALLNIAGEVIGINSVKYASAEVEGMGYAIPISSAIPMINELMNRELVSEEDQGFLGIYIDTAQEVTTALAQRFNMPVGIYVNDIVEKSPAEAAGLRQGHIITKVNGRKVQTMNDLVNFLSYTRAGETITITVSVLDNGEYVEKDLSITLGERK